MAIENPRDSGIPIAVDLELGELEPEAAWAEVFKHLDKLRNKIDKSLTKYPLIALIRPDNLEENYHKIIINPMFLDAEGRPTIVLVEYIEDDNLYHWLAEGEWQADRPTIKNIGQPDPEENPEIHTPAQIAVVATAILSSYMDGLDSKLALGNNRIPLPKGYTGRAS